MARQSMVLKLDRPDDPRLEGVTLKADLSWISPAGGWLSVQNGTYDRTPGGIAMNSTGGHGGNVATLQGLNFFTNAVGDRGRAIYPDTGNAGNWTVMEVMDDVLRAEK